MIDRLFLYIEHDRHIIIRSADDAEDCKLHIRFGQFGIFCTQAANGAVQGFVYGGNQFIQTLLAHNQFLVAVGLQPFREFYFVATHSLHLYLAGQIDFLLQTFECQLQLLHIFVAERLQLPCLFPPALLPIAPDDHKQYH